MPPDCENCRACIANPDKVRYNGATKNKGGFEMEDNVIVKEDKVGPIQRYYYEDMMCRRDKEVEKWHKAWKTTFIALIVAVCIIIGFVYYEAQYVDEVTETIETFSEGGGNAYGTIVSGDGSEVNYGTSESNQNEKPNS